MHHFEDILIDLHTEVDIQRMDYWQLSIKQTIDFNFAEIPVGVEDHDHILDQDYM